MREPPALEQRQGRLADKVVLVIGGGTTGESPGTGAATARLFSAQGARVGVVGRSSHNTEKTVELIREAGDEAVGILAEATVERDCASAVEQVIDRWGRLDVVVNNLGHTDSSSVADFDESVWDRTLAANLKSVLFVAKHAVPHLRRQETSSIVNVGSVAGLQAIGTIPPDTSSLAYGTSKGALVALTREMAAELGPDGVRVNLVVPGHLSTPVASADVAGPADVRRRVTMLRTGGTAWDAACAALFLACDESRYITAVVLPVDGGVTSSLLLTTHLRLLAENEAGSV
jgi:NAD(P)-dependent dehydrogenase (short-subunit alcohol dehydrogenase family)